MLGWKESGKYYFESLKGGYCIEKYKLADGWWCGLWVRVASKSVGRKVRYVIGEGLPVTHEWLGRAKELEQAKALCQKHYGEAVGDGVESSAA